MNRYFGFGDDILQIDKIWHVIKGPFRFFEKNKDKDEELINFLTLIIRINVVIMFIVEGFQNNDSYINNLILLVSVLVLAKVLASISIKIGSEILNFFVRTWTRKNNIMAAKRIFVFSAVAGLIPAINVWFERLGLIFYLFLITIGIAKQYKVSYKHAFMSVLMVFLVIAFILILFLFMIIGSVESPLAAIKGILWYALGEVGKV
jgi:hypothetical protein